MLKDVRVLEISDLPTMMAGQILADLGADVVTVEPPGGAPGRRIEPFAGDIPGLERSLTWQSLNRNKRGMTLRSDCADGRDLIAALGAKFDIVIEAAWTGAGAPLRDIALPEHVVHCVITPFSRVGPKSGYRAGDLTLMAASGAPGMAGEPDRPPLFFPVPQAMLEAGAETAVAALAGLAAKGRGGLGQDVDISARTAAMMSAFSRTIAAFSGDKPAVRSGLAGGGLAGVRSLPGIFSCRDGYMLVSIVFGAGFIGMTKQMARWAIAEGALAPAFAEVDWLGAGRSMASNPAARRAVEALVEAVTDLCAARCKTEIAAAARLYGFMAAPVMTMEDIANAPQYRERGLFVPASIAADGPVIDVPARFAQYSNYSIEIRRPAPRLSEHTAEILNGELHLSMPEVQALFIHGVI